MVEWPKQILTTNKVTDSLPLVYVLIQQLPQLKWFQVTQVGIVMRHE